MMALVCVLRLRFVDEQPPPWVPGFRLGPRRRITDTDLAPGTYHADAIQTMLDRPSEDALSPYLDMNTSGGG